MIDNKTKEIYLRGGLFKGLLNLAIIYNGIYSLYDSSFGLDDYSLLRIASGKEGTYMIEANSLKKYNLKGNINENKAITKYT